MRRRRPIPLSAQITTATAIAALSASPGTAGEEPAPRPAEAPTERAAAPEPKAIHDDYIRFYEPAGAPRAQLQTAVAHYRRPDGTEVDLIGVVHIGDEAYYKTLNEQFKAYDALLFEMVGADPDKPVTKEMLQQNKKNPLRFFQLLTAGMLEVKFQLDHIDYAAPNFVHADMDMETFQRRQEEKGENLLSLIEKGHAAQEGGGVDFNEMFKLFGSDSTPDGNKLTLGRQFHHIEGLLGGMEGEEGSVLVGERNIAALEVMQREIGAGKKKLGIFYGAAHLPDFDRRLRADFGFERTGTDWLNAWDIDKAAAEAAEEEKVPADEPETEKKKAA